MKIIAFAKQTADFNVTYILTKKAIFLKNCIPQLRGNRTHGIEPCVLGCEIGRAGKEKF